ncbi:MAG: tetratricopeptide repeat protein [Sphingobacteriales bacterium]|nr:tetratricopeptide repeat protein [Sphingobacteriales bacterium]
MKFSFVLLIAVVLQCAACKQNSDPAAHTPNSTAADSTAAIGDSALLAQIQRLNTQIGKDSSNAELYFMRGMAQWENRQSAAALADMNKAINLDATASKYYLSAADMLLQMRDLNTANTLLERGLQQSPDKPEKIAFQLARNYFILKQYDEAMAKIHAILKEKPEFAEAHFLKALIYKEKENTNAAISALQDAISIDNNYYDAYMQLGLLYSEKNNPLAIKYFDNALKTDTASTEAQYGKAMFYQQRKDYKQAKKIYRSMLRSSSQHENALYNLGYILLEEDSVELAEKHFEIATKVAPSYAAAYYMRGLCAETRGDTRTALQYYKQALTFKNDLEPAAEGVKRLDVKN